LIVQDGNGTKLSKFHQNLHFPRNIWCQGSVLNFDGGRPEAIAQDLENLLIYRLKNIINLLPFKLQNNFMKISQNLNVNNCTMKKSVAMKNIQVEEEIKVILTSIIMLKEETMKIWM